MATILTNVEEEGVPPDRAAGRRRFYEEGQRIRDAQVRWSEIRGPVDVPNEHPRIPNPAIYERLLAQRSSEPLWSTYAAGDVIVAQALSVDCLRIRFVGRKGMVNVRLPLVPVGMIEWSNYGCTFHGVEANFNSLHALRQALTADMDRAIAFLAEMIAHNEAVKRAADADERPPVVVPDEPEGSSEDLGLYVEVDTVDGDLFGEPPDA